MNTKECYRGVRRRAVAGVWRKGRQERGHHTIMDTYTCTLTFVYITQGVIKMGGGGLFLCNDFRFLKGKYDPPLISTTTALVDCKMVHFKQELAPGLLYDS